MTTCAEIDVSRVCHCDGTEISSEYEAGWRILFYLHMEVRMSRSYIVVDK